MCNNQKVRQQMIECALGSFQQHLSTGMCCGKKHSNSKFRNLSFSVAEQFVAKGQMWCVQFSAASECASRPTRYQHDFADQTGAQEKFKSKNLFSLKIFAQMDLDLALDRMT